MKKRWGILILTFISVVLLSHNQSATAEPDEPAAPESAEPLWEGAEKISQASEISGAIQPSLAASPNGAKLITVYSGILGGNNADHDVYYAMSTNYGDTWPTKARIHPSPGASSDSNFVDVAISPNGKGHAVWAEEVSDIPTIVYKNEDDWNSAANLRTISNPATPIVIAEPRIVAKSNMRLDVVWAQGLPTTNVNIYHAYSVNTGSTWNAPAAIVDTAPTSRLPDIAVDAAGVYHVVWEEGTVPVRTIHYLRGVPAAANTVNWNDAAEINISQTSITNGTPATQPRIIADGNVLHVTYTNINTDGSQSVHHIRCNGNCSNLANWRSEGNPVSGQFLGAKATDPFDVISAVGVANACTYVYFHGTQGASSTANEQIWGVNSCGNWSASARDQVTGTNMRAINPSMVSSNNWWLYLAYEQVDTANSSIREVYFVRNQPAIYLPLILKQ